MYLPSLTNKLIVSIMTINLQILQQIYNYNLKFSLIDIDFGKLCVYFIKMTFFDMLSTVLS